MDEKIYELANLEIWNRNGHFFVRLRQYRGGAGAQYLGDGFCAVVAGIGLAGVLGVGQ